MKKTIIHQFDPVIYPIKLWVISEMDGVIIQRSFRSSNGSELDMSESEGGICYTYGSLVVNKKTKDYGFMVVMKRDKTLNVGGIAHEATHVARLVWEHIMEDYPAREADAYLVQWVSDCIDKVIKNKE